MKHKSRQHYKDNYHVQAEISKLNLLTYGFISSYEPESVFEFGCNMGRHLNQLRDLFKCHVFGIDINENSIRSGNKLFGFENLIKDETYLKEIPTNSYDIVFTNSVLCHIEEIDDIVKELRRIARTAVVVCETRLKKGEHWYNHGYNGFTSVISQYAKTVGCIYEVMYISAT